MANDVVITGSAKPLPIVTTGSLDAAQRNPGPTLDNELFSWIPCHYIQATSRLKLKRMVQKNNTK